MTKRPSIFGEFNQPSEDFNSYIRNLESDTAREVRKRMADRLNEVGIVPPPSPEILERRARYDNDPANFAINTETGDFFRDQVTSLPNVPNHYIIAHREIYTNSTGLKPLSLSQEDSVRHSQQIIQRGGKIVKAEPRGFGKTSRSCNEGLLGVLQGHISYLLIIGSTTEKAEEIINSIVTELIENEMLAQLYPDVIRCFRHVSDNPRKAIHQTYDGEYTHIDIKEGLIRFPILPDSPSSAAVINVRPKKNVRGIYFVDEAGPYAGKRRRPSHVIFDDVQTDEEAENPKTVDRIVRTIKKSILRSGSHSKKLRCIMSGTPICPGDVTHHFLLNEPWQHVIYQMLLTRAENEELWFGEYAERLLGFDKRVPGSMERAARHALAFYEEHREEMDHGALASWEWCYEYDDDPQLEISAIQHAYNIMIMEGMEVFESECQCNVIATAAAPDITFCSIDHIMHHTSHFDKYKLAIKSRHLVAHIDVGIDYFTYVVIGTPIVASPQIIDYGSYPSYPGRFGKGKMTKTLTSLYPELSLPEDRVARATTDLINDLANRNYVREDGVVFKISLILTDDRYMQEHVHKGIRTSPHRNICYAAEGYSYKARDKPMADKFYSDACTKYHHVVLSPTSDRTLMKAIVDIYHFKTLIHIAFARHVDSTGALTLFLPEYSTQHVLLGEHCVSEIPTWDIDPRTDKRLVIWNQIHGADNEYFDNLVGCFAAMAILNVSFDIQDGSSGEPYDISKFIREHR